MGWDRLVLWAPIGIRMSSDFVVGNQEVDETVGCQLHVTVKCNAKGGCTFKIFYNMFRGWYVARRWIVLMLSKERGYNGNVWSGALAEPKQRANKMLKGGNKR